MRNNVHIRGALKAGVARTPFEVTGLDVDNGLETPNHADTTWSADLKIFFTRSLPYEKNGQATIEADPLGQPLPRKCCTGAGHWLPTGSIT